MNAHRRVMDCLGGFPTDRAPVFAVLGAYGGKLTGTTMSRLYRDAEAWVAGQKAVQDTFVLDMALATFDYSAIAEAFGGETAWSERQAPTMKRPGAASSAQALAMPLPDPDRTGALPSILSATRLMADLYRERVPLFAVVPGPCSLPSLILGMEAWMDTLLFEEDAAERVMDRSDEFFASWVGALQAAGADGIVVTEGMACAEMSPRALFEARMLPRLRTAFARSRGPLVFHHGGGRINHILDLLPGLPGLAGVVVSSKDDLAEARRLVGPKLPLIGNLDNLGFPSASASDIRARCRDCLRAAAGGPFVLSHSAADIPLESPPENIAAMLEASRAWASGDREGP